MKFALLDGDYETVAIIDEYESMIWSDRFNSAGDFELYIDAHSALYPLLKRGLYIWSDLSDRLMVIEAIALDTDSENGDHVTVTGRSLESYLARRVCWGFYDYADQPIQTVVKDLLNKNAISPTTEGRKIPGLTFKDNESASLTDIKVTVQLAGESLYDTIQQLCEEADIGFKITPIFDGGEDKMVFELYEGVNRSWDQEENLPVTFSDKYDNLLSTSYYETDEGYSNVAFVMGEGEGSGQKFAEAVASWYGEEVPTGLDRREISCSSDASSETGQDDDGNPTYMTPAQYTALLVADGKIELNDYKPIVMLDGEITSESGQFKYGEDFFIGDIVHVIGPYSQEFKSRVKEMTISHDATGASQTPTFEALV